MRWAFVNQGGLAGSVVTTSGLARALVRHGDEVLVFPFTRPDHLWLEHTDILVVEGYNPRFAQWPSFGKYKSVFWCLSFQGSRALPHRTVEMVRNLGYDGIMTNSQRFYDYIKGDIPSEFSMLAADCDEFRDVKEVPKSMVADTCYVGCWPHKDSEQEAFILGGAASHSNLAIYGGGWDKSPWSMRHRGPLPLGQTYLAYSATKLILGMIEEVQAEWNMLNNRVFEALACNRMLVIPKFTHIQLPEELSPFIYQTESMDDYLSVLADPPFPVMARETIKEHHSWDSRLRSWFKLVEKLHRPRHVHIGAP